MKQCQDVKIVYSLHMLIGVFWNSLLIWKVISHQSETSNELSAAEKNKQHLWAREGVLIAQYTNKNITCLKWFSLHNSMRTRLIQRRITWVILQCLFNPYRCDKQKKVLMTATK